MYEVIISPTSDFTKYGQSFMFELEWQAKEFISKMIIAGIDSSRLSIKYIK